VRLSAYFGSILTCNNPAERIYRERTHEMPLDGAVQTQTRHSRFWIFHCSPRLMSNSDSSAPAEEVAEPRLGFEIELFTKHVDSLSQVLFPMVMSIQEITKKAKEKLQQFELDKCDIAEENGEKTVTVPSNHVRAWNRLNRTYEHFGLARSLLPRSVVVSIISQYDAYLGRLLRAIFVRKPELLNASERKLSFESLSAFSSIDAAREYILEKEVEAILRSSHIEQFKWMAKTFDLPLTKGLTSWPVFVELTERRNLFVHTDGVISSQYISICKIHGWTVAESLKEGERLGVPQDYFRDAHNCVYEIGVKLGHVLWRKLFPNEREQADRNLIGLTYDLIDNGRHELAIRLLDFACTEFKKFSNEVSELTLLVNRAQAYKWKGDADQCAEIMNVTP
jgi:hypothetical protein